MKTFRMRGTRPWREYSGRLSVYFELRAKNKQDALRTAEGRGVEDTTILSDVDYNAWINQK